MDLQKKELLNKNPAKKQHKHTKSQILENTECLDFMRNITWLANYFSLTA
jgi:hypothetical protein